MTAVTEKRPGVVTMPAHKAKDGAPYNVNVGARHVKVLRTMREAGFAYTDAQLTFVTGMHMAAARRCELRDIGAVHQVGTRDGSKTWAITDAGRALLKQMEDNQ